MGRLRHKMLQPLGLPPALIGVLTMLFPETVSGRSEQGGIMAAMIGSLEVEEKLKAHVVIHFTLKFVGRLSKTTTLRLRTL